MEFVRRDDVVLTNYIGKMRAHVERYWLLAMDWILQGAD